MKKWVDVMSTHVHDGIWVYDYQQFGDWLALDGPKNFNDKPGTIGGTEMTYICTTYYLYSLRLTAKAAKVLGKKDDFIKYNEIAEKTLKAIRDEYFTPNGRCAIQTQTALSLAIIHDLYPEGKIDASVASLYKLLKNNDFHICTGYIGTQIVCKALTKGGYFSDAMTTFMKKDYPGWLYPVTKGATTIWERWNGIKPDGEILVGMNSFNHYAYGSICEWIYEDICGIVPVEDSPGFAKVIIRPHPTKKLESAQCKFDSPMGRFECRWSIEYYKIALKIVIPFNVEAKLVLLNIKKDSVYSASFELVEDGNDLVADLNHGEYEILYRYKDQYYILPERFQ